jgi:phosphatidylserine/phosphatidylglycerophosphate/cardiolipin synthase-like enzyme
LPFAAPTTPRTRTIFLPGFKTFESVFPNPPKGSVVSSRDHPIQGFVWGDYTAKPGHTYTYHVSPVRGQPKNLQIGAATSVKVTTENPDAQGHGIFFNRGVAGSQAYGRKFEDKSPQEIGQEAWDWLSRGLVEALLAFIAQANGAKFTLHAAVYEFNYEPVLKAFKKAHSTGATVKIVYDARSGTGKPSGASTKAINKVGIKSLTIKRTKDSSHDKHNKFIVLLEDGVPIQVWTGSTNISAGGIFGHSNVGHIVRDPAVAAAYDAYWHRLAKDPDPKNSRPDNVTATPDPNGPPAANGITPFFSPRKTMALLDWYADRMGATKDCVCFTAAFGVNQRFAKVLNFQPGGAAFMRYVLLEKPGATFDMFAGDNLVKTSVGDLVTNDALYRWAKERLSGLNKNVRYMHTKYMLIDPTGNDPIVVSGSANFSENSTTGNDENMLVIRGDTRTADIYLGEFMRLFNHFAFRHWLNGRTSPSRPRSARPRT